MKYIYINILNILSNINVYCFNLKRIHVNTKCINFSPNMSMKYTLNLYSKYMQVWGD